jgi:hypothetical protein
LAVATIDRRILFPLGGLLASTTQCAQLRSLGAIALFIGILGGLMYRVGFPVISVLPWDIAIQLDGAWRIVHGQIPSVNFRSVIPPMTLELSALGIVLGSPSATCIARGNLLLFLVLTPWAWIIARSRLSATYAFIFAALVGLLVVTPRPLGDKIAASSYAMLYNRQGWAILSVVLLSLLVPVLPDRKDRSIASGLGNGVLLALLSFSKLNFLAVGIAAIVLHALMARQAWIKLVLAVVVSYLAAMLLLHAVFGLSFTAYLNETVGIARVYVQGKLSDLVHIGLKNLDQLFIVAALTVLCFRETAPSGSRANTWTRSALLVSISFICGSGLALTATSAQRIDIPAIAMAGLICAEWLRRASIGKIDTCEPTSGLTYVFASAILVPLLVGPLLGKDTAAILNAATLHAGHKAPVGTEGFHSATLRDFVIPSDRTVISDIAPSQPAAVYPAQVNDGIELLRRHVGDQARVLALDFSNPFPFALDLPPVRGGSTSWLLDASFSKSVYLAPEDVFGDADYVMIPRYERNSTTVLALRQIYAPYIVRNFRLVDRTEIWDLYQRSATDFRESNARALSFSAFSIASTLPTSGAR